MKKAYWNPYLVGIGIGVLSWVVFALVDKPIGISTAISQASGAVVAAAAGSEQVAANPYWAKNVPAWDYGTLFLVGTFFGALASSLAGKTFKFEWVPQVWQERFGGSRVKRAATAFIGGALILFGARMAGGCTSGHGISGTLQLAVSSWVFFVTMFVAGLVTAKLMFVKK
ncbi:MAG: YeeE/YedE family protein [Deltaproteobacteria bacterium]|nr:YeeE/YedE family protein [Deltaproteobacteria bacterium]